MQGATDTYPRTRFKHVDDDLLCCLCNGVPKNPMVAPCQHVCCPACLEGWHGCCPQCGASWSPQEWGPPGRIVQNMYKKLDILCEYSTSGCDFSVKFGNLEELDEHLAHCPKAICRCSNEGCTFEGPRDTIELHEQKQCEHRLVYCELCDTAVKYNAIQEHKTSFCPMMEIECTCGQKMLRKDKEAHLLRCPHRVLVVCPVAGCGQRIPQGDLETHISGSLSMHFQLLSVATQERDSTISRLADQLTQTQKKLAEAEEKIANLEADKHEQSWYGMGLWRRDEGCRNVWTIGNMNQRLKDATLKHQASAQRQPGCSVYVPILLWSPQYYTQASFGYRFSLCLNISVHSVGLFIHLHEGEYDDQLPWPFNLDYTVQLGTIQSTITQRDSYMHYTSQGRPPHELSWGWANFCDLNSFKEALQNDSIEITAYFHASHASVTPHHNGVAAGMPMGQHHYHQQGVPTAPQQQAIQSHQNHKAPKHHPGIHPGQMYAAVGQGY